MCLKAGMMKIQTVFDDFGLMFVPGRLISYLRPALRDLKRGKARANMTIYLPEPYEFRLTG